MRCSTGKAAEVKGRAGLDGRMGDMSNSVSSEVELSCSQRTVRRSLPVSPLTHPQVATLYLFLSSFPGGKVRV